MRMNKPTCKVVQIRELTKALLLEKSRDWRTSLERAQVSQVRIPSLNALQKIEECP
jgi:hypothetical protein